MRIGVHPVGGPESGGIWQVSLSVLEVLAAPGAEDDIVAVVRSPASRAGEHASSKGLPIVTLPPPRTLPQRVADRARLAMGRQMGVHADLDRPRRQPRVTRALRAAGIRLMVYPWPTAIAFEAGLPYVFFVHDLQHRLHPEFPEVSAAGEWERREYIFRNGIRRAAVVVAESEVGKEDILELYGDAGIAAERVLVLPYLPGTPPGAPTEDERRRVRRRYALPERYLFYPAHFWPHKNHRRLVEALPALDGDVALVLSGSHEGELRAQTYATALEAARRCGVVDRVRVIGYAPGEDMPGLYAEAAALVMPTFFGPTNIPILEAWALGCPVVTSDIRGVREQAGDAAVLVDPASVEAIAAGVARVLSDESLRAGLIARGSQRLSAYSFDDHRERLEAIVGVAKGSLPESR
jgi:glycosyltransferase involved in cell wall biosynthesis